MGLFVKSFQLIGLVFFFISCSTGAKKERMEVRDLYQKGLYSEALSALEKDKIKNDNNAKLLYFFERGTIFYAQKNYFLALKSFETALDLQRDLYTTRISKKIAGQLGNDNEDIYYGARYEHSLLYYYLILTHLNLSRVGVIEKYSLQDLEPFQKFKNEAENTQYEQKVLSEKEKRDHLSQARSILLLWDTFLSNSLKMTQGQAVYKEDLMAKILGALIHLSFDRNEDRQIAFQLLKDAKKVIFRYYNNYRTFNGSFQNFQKNFSNFHHMDESAIKKEFITPTNWAKNLNDWLDSLTASVTKKNRPNVIFTVDLDLIPTKEAKEYNIGFNAASDASGPDGKKSLGGASMAVLSVFAADVLGLVPKSNEGWSGPGAALGMATASLVVENAGISFKLPHIKNLYQNKTFKIEVLDTHDSKKVWEGNLPLVEPLSDMAEQDIEEHATALYWRVGSRMAMKHVAAIVAAYGTYTLMVGKSGNSDGAKFLAKNAAILEYLVASKAIEASENPDLRQWVTLPAVLSVQALNLKKGTYLVRLINVDEGGGGVDLGNIEVKDAQSMQFFSFRR